MYAMSKEMDEIQEVAIQIDGQSETAENQAEDEDRLQILMKKKLGGLPLNRCVTIFRLPDWIHENNKECCEPKMVAIGPYHHGKEDLRTMEEHKWYTLHAFLAHNNNVDLEIYLREMRSIEEQARNCYSDAVDMGSDDFVRMLLLDGCFMLEYILKNTSNKSDVLCDVGWADGKFLPDMCMLENQIPFFVIHKLWTINQGMGWKTSNCKDGCGLLQLLFKFLKDRYSIIQFNPPQTSCNNVHHLLHLCYLGVAGTESSKQGKPDLRTGMPTIPCASKLKDAGINIMVKKKPTKENMFHISFANGTLEMPYVQFYNSRIIILWNMVAFEQSYLLDCPQILSSYMALMSSLINTEKDIILLQRSGTLEHFFKSAEEAAAFFKQFESYFVLYPSQNYFYDLFKAIKEYSESIWPKRRARLKQDYFSNPWAIVSVVPAGILLVLTFLQTYYSAVK